MGNTSTRYVTAPVAADILGGPDSLNALKSKLEKIVGKYIDFRVYHEVILRKFEKIPRVLCECLFRAFAADLGSRVELDAFLAGYAIMETTIPNYKSSIANLNAIQARFLFRVYENEYSGSSTGTLHRRRIEDMLKLAYGDRLKPHIGAVTQQLDSIFSRFQATEITLKEFESCNVKLDMLSGWVRSVLRAFFATDVQHSRLYHLERKYSAQLEAQEIMSTYQLSRSVCDDLRRRFFELCNSPHNSDIAANSLGIDGGDQQVVHLGVRAELRCSAWLHGVASVPNEVNGFNTSTLTSTNTSISTTANSTAHSTATDTQSIPYLDHTLARVMFESRVDAFKPKWRFLDFATFCAVFGGENRTLQAVTVTDAFIQCALSDYYNNKLSTVNKATTSASVPAVASATVQGHTQARVPVPVLNRESSAESMSSDTSAVPSDPHTYSNNNSQSNSTVVSSPFAQLSPQSPTPPPVGADMSNVDNYILSALCDMIYTLSRSATSRNCDSYTDTAGSAGTSGTSAVTGEFPRVLTLGPTAATQLPKDLAEALLQLQHTEPEGYAMAFSTLIISHYSQLPGMRDLSLCACCRFGFNPSSPLREMEYVTELSLRYLQQYPQTSVHPSGPVDSEWCVIPKQWYDNWKLYVGHHQHQVPHISPGTSTIGTSMNTPAKSTKSRNIDTSTGSYSNPYSHYNFQSGAQGTYIPASVAGSVLDLDGLVSDSPPRAAFYSSVGGAAGGVSQGRAVTTAAAATEKGDTSGSNRITSMKRAGPPPVRPPSIDNTTLLKRTTYNAYHSHSSAHTSTSKGVYGRQGQLLPNLVIGRDIEVVAPAVYDTLVAWYGGGPRISRKVVAVTKPGASNVDSGTAGAVAAGGSSGIYSRANTAYGFGASPAASPRFSASSVASELELYPLCLVIHTCDNAGYMHTNPLCDALFSKTCTVHDIAVYLCSTHTIDLPRVRLWNYAQPNKEQWRDQYILSPELTLQRANLVDNQIILLEVSLLDGAWPRSLLHAHLDAEERVSQDTSVPDESAPVSAVVGEESAIVSDTYVDEYTGIAGSVLVDSEGHSNTSGLVTGDTSMVGTDGAEPGGEEASGAVAGTTTVLGAPLPSKRSFSSGRKGSRGTRDATGITAITTATTTARRNSGLVGLDNLGNTCYMNSSLQALLHTEPLTQYFLSNAYTRHVNLHSMHGFHGKLAASYGRLAQEVFCTTSNCVTPRAFKYDIANLHEQFAGNEQHDAHELLAFLLDGLSEDLNLVHTKPYTTQPDSDGRSDHVLADIWWGNHLKRDRSVIQALFSGQFKSVMTCTAPGCGYSSARFEPFNFLSVPVPEESERLLTVTVVPLLQQYTVYCEVRVPKNGTIQDIVNGVLQQDIYGIDDSIDYTKYTASSRHKRHKRHHRGPHSHATTSSAGKPEFYFQAGELANNRIRSFNSLDRRIDSIRDNEYLVLYQVRRLPGDIERTVKAIDTALVDTADASMNASVGASVSGSVSGSGSADVGNTAGGASNVVSANIAIPGSGPPSPQSPGSAPGSAPVLQQVAPVSALTDSVGVDKSNTGGAGTAHAGRNVFNPETLYGDYCKADKLVRVALTQRRVRMHDASLFVTNTSSDFSLLGPGGLFSSGSSALGTNATAGGGSKGLNNANGDNGGCTGGEYFKLESFGLSSLEVLPNRIRCGDLYRLVAKRYSAYLKVPVKALIRHRQAQRQHLKHTSSASSLSSLGNGTSKGDAAPALGSAEEYPINLRMAQIGSADTDEVVGGAIPEEGFTLRLVNGGTGASSSCSRCPWLMHCDGCVLPDHNDVEVELRDGESIAVDWHFIVFEDLLDAPAMCNIRSHSTNVQNGVHNGARPASPTSPVSPASQQGRADNYIHTPLQRCLDKFTEQEKLEGVVCPRCRASDGNMCKSFTLWRLPPVLIVQLKRFQFDQYSRRKLNNHIDFPFEGLDLFDYLATSRKRGLSTVSLPDTAAEGAGATQGEMSVDSKALAMAALYGDSSSVPVSPRSPIAPSAHTSAATAAADTVTASTSAGVTNTATIRASTQAHASTTTKAQESTEGTAACSTTATTATQEPISEEFAPDTDDQCTKYDLYSVIHHAGALGGGHYATTARALNIRSSASGTNTSGGAGTVSATSEGNNTTEGSWYVYNDHMVSKVTDTREICSPSAYVLFYMRQDMRQGDVLALLRRQLSIPQSLHEEGEHTENTAPLTSSASQFVPPIPAPQASIDTAIAPEDVTLHVLPPPPHVQASTAAVSRGDTIGTTANNGFSGFIDGDAESDEVLRNLRKHKQQRQSKFAADNGGREDSGGGCIPS